MRNSHKLSLSDRPPHRQHHHHGSDRGQVQEDQVRELRQVPRQDRGGGHDQEGEIALMHSVWFVRDDIKFVGHCSLSIHLYVCLRV